MADRDTKPDNMPELWDLIDSTDYRDVADEDLYCAECGLALCECNAAARMSRGRADCPDDCRDAGGCSDPACDCNGGPTLRCC